MAIILFNYFFSVYRIFSDSMYPALNKGNYVLVLKTDKVKNNDIVLLNIKEHAVIRRIIALARDEIDIDRNGNVFINNKYLDEPYINNKSYSSMDNEFPCKVEKDNVFVMGDNRTHTSDSRVRNFGTVPQNKVRGKIIFVLYPIGILKN